MEQGRKLLGTVTIGQSPRADLIPEMKPFLGPDVEVIEAGALDGLTLGEVHKLYPVPGDYVLITRMRDGTQVKIAEKHILPLMQDKIDKLVAQGAQVIALVCTGEFPEFRCSKLLVQPQRVLFNTVKSVAEGLNLGVLTPDDAQVENTTLRWSKLTPRVTVEAASPYGSADAVLAAAEKLREAGVQIAVLDCIGYTNAAKTAVKRMLGVPVILARSVVARVIGELM